MSLPTLYKKADNGAIIEWTIRTDKDDNGQGVVTTRWGQEGGAFQETREVITSGKNVGKKNETSAYEQACKDAQSKWEKQQKSKKYVQSREAALSGERDEQFVAGGIDPMLAFPRDKKPNALVLPCDDQPKLDGHRCEAEVKCLNGLISVTLWSRTRKPILSMPHIVQALRQHFAKVVATWDGSNDSWQMWLDGELYNHDLEVPQEFLEDAAGDAKKARFEYLTSLIRPKEPVEGHEKVQYHIYDIATEFSWNSRRERLAELLKSALLPLVQVETRRANTEEELAAHEEDYVAAGYEGLMARNLAGLYVGKRSADLLKVKRFQDSEFEVHRMETETREVTNSAGTQTMLYARLICKLPGWQSPGDKEHEFDTTINGSQELQRRLLSMDVAGRSLTVKYQGFTAGGKPRFPKGLRFREDV